MLQDGDVRRLEEILEKEFSCIVAPFCNVNTSYAHKIVPLEN